VETTLGILKKDISICIGLFITGNNASDINGKINL